MNNKQDLTNGEEKMREEFKESVVPRIVKYGQNTRMETDTLEKFIADWWLTQLKQYHIALLEQIIVENEGRRKATGKNTKDFIIMNGQSFEVREELNGVLGHFFNSALDLINTDLRAKIEELKKTNISN